MSGHEKLLEAALLVLQACLRSPCPYGAIISQDEKCVESERGREGARSSKQAPGRERGGCVSASGRLGEDKPSPLLWTGFACRSLPKHGRGDVSSPSYWPLLLVTSSSGRGAILTSISS